MVEKLEDYIGKPVPPEIIELIDGMKGKRSLIVVKHIMEHGYVTNAQLSQVYNYTHGPRAVKDARDKGIPIKTIKVRFKAGEKPVDCYVFDDISNIRNDKLSGRKPLDKKLKPELAVIHGEKCLICNEDYELRYLQTDHRVPYDVVGENSSYRYEVDKYMLLCGTCNRAKSWSCEQCANFKNAKDESICKSCYWASPTEYQHIALKQEKRAQIVFSNRDIEIHSKIEQLSKEANKSFQETLLELLKKAIE